MAITIIDKASILKFGPDMMSSMDVSEDGNALDLQYYRDTTTTVVGMTSNVHVELDICDICWR